MKRSLLTVLLGLVWIYAGLNAQELHLISASVAPGEVLTCFIHPANGLSETRFVLEDSEGKTLDSHTGFFWSPVKGEKVLIGQFGISSTVKSGIGTVKVSYKTAYGREEQTALIEISTRDFLAEEIPLSSEATGILSKPDPRKREQAKTLWNILLTWNNDHIFTEGPFHLPVKEFEETSWYGDRRVFRYDNGGSATTIHGGLDLAAATGTPILAPAAGLVVMAEFRIISGWTVVMEHAPGVYSLYYHLSELNTAEGQNVETGTLLGLMGATGLVTGPHLHWEIKIHGISVDPKWFLTHPLLDKEAILGTINNTFQKRR